MPINRLLIIVVIAIALFLMLLPSLALFATLAHLNLASQPFFLWAGYLFGILGWWRLVFTLIVMAVLALRLWPRSVE